MKKAFSLLAVILFAWLTAGSTFLSPALAQQKAKDVRFVLVGAAEGAPEGAAEAMALNMYLGALDYRLRVYAPLKGKYNLRYVDTLFNSANDCLTGVSSGAVEMTWSAPHYLEQLEPAWRLGGIPGLFNSWDHFINAMNTKEWKAVHERTSKEKGVTILKWMMSAGDFYLFTKKGPVNSMADLKAQKIRYPGGEGYSRALKVLGVTPISLPYTEVVSALQTNMIEGLLTDIFSAHYFYELPRYTKYHIPVTWGIQPICFVVQTKWWESLPEEDRRAMNDVFERIDVAPYFNNAQAGLNSMWAKGPNTVACELETAEVEKWKEIMRDSSAGLLSGIDPKLVEAIKSAK